MNEQSIQGILDFNTGNQDGYENHLREQEAKNQRIRDVWKLPVGKKVRVTLYNVHSCFEGKLIVPEHPKIFDKRIPLHLKIDRTGFYHTEIESCTVVE